MSQSNTCVYKKSNQEVCQEKVKTNKISIAISNKILTKDESKVEVKEFTYFENIEYSFLADKLKEGRSIAFNFVYGDNQFYANKKHFKSADFICIDIDNDNQYKITIDDILKSNDEKPKYIRENACLIYTSANHRKGDNSDRYKVLFHLHYSIDNWDTLVDILKSFKRKFPEIDQANYITGRYHSGGGHTKVIILGKRLSDNALEELLNAHKPDTQFKDNISGTKITPQYAKAVYRGELSEFPQEASKDKHNRNTVLYKISRRIGEMLPYLDYSYNEVFLEIVRVAESIGTDKSYTSKDIRKTIENGLNKGLQNPIQSHTSIEYKGYGYDTDTTDSNVFFKPYRQFATKDYNNAIQFPKGNMNTLKNEILSLMVIDDEKKVDHIKELYAIKGETNDQNVQVFYILKSLESWDLHKYYMGYWVYSNEVKAIDNEFYDLRLNDVLECMYNGNFKDINSKYERYKLFDVTNALAFMQTRIVENNTMKVVKQYLDYEARIKNNGKIDKTKLKKLILFNRTSNIMGCYSPKTIFRLSGNDFGLAFYLTENINRNCLCRERRKNGEKYYLPPTLSKTPLKWDSEYACQCAGLLGTFNINESKAISDLENRLDTLKDYAIVNRWEYRKDENKYHIYICNPFA